MAGSDPTGAGHRYLPQSRSSDQGGGFSTAVAAQESRGLSVGGAGGYAPTNLGGGGGGIPEGAPGMAPSVPVTSASGEVRASQAASGGPGGAGAAGAESGGGGGCFGSSMGMATGVNGAGTSPGASSTAATPLPKPIRRRMRMITSCLECRRRKLKCNKSQPCTNCLKFGRECHYLGPKLDEASQLKLTQIKEKVGSLERQLERDVVSKSNGLPGRGVFYQQGILADEVGDEDDEERDLEYTPMVALDVTYDEDDDDGVPDDVIDLGIQVGRMRITERIGGLSRPRLSEEIGAGLAGGGPARTPPYQPGGQQPGISPPGMGNAPDSGTALPDFLRPSASYMVPTGGFFFGQIVESPSLEEFLPHRPVTDLLLQRYFDAVHPVARCVHRPTFESQYLAFWEDASLGREPRASIQALMFAAWFSALVSMDEDYIARTFGVAKDGLVAKMKLGAETALSKANFLRTTKLDTMQAFVMYMIPLCRAEVSRAHSVLVGAAVRMAECMGLHRDGETYALTPLETHVRRLIWHQLCFLDIRTCEAQGPKPAIRREDYDTKLPLNYNEEELTNAVAPLQPSQHWTAMLLPLVRFEINEMMRIIWMDRRRLESRRTTLAAVLTKIENFRKRMMEKYNHLLDDAVPIQKYTKLVMHLLLCRLHAMVLHPYHSNTANPMPPRLSNILIHSGIMIIEISIQLETDALFREWRWYLGAYQQFQIALLLATEVYYRPHNKEADRIWACLDYVFNMDRNSTREEKGMQILHEIMSKSAVYTALRKLRPTHIMAQAVPEKDAIKSDIPTPPFGSGNSVASMTHSPPETAQPYAAGTTTYATISSSTGNPQTASSMKMEPESRNMVVTQQQRRPQEMPVSSTEQQRQYYENQWQGQAQTMPMAPAPVPNMAYAGVSADGQSLWGVPPPQSVNMPFMGNLDEAGGHGGNVASMQQGRQQSQAAGHNMYSPPGLVPSQQQQQPGPPMSQAGNEMQGLMTELDWETLSAIFPYDPRTGELSVPGYTDPAIGMRWS